MNIALGLIVKFFAYLHYMDEHAPYTLNSHNTRYAEKIIEPYVPGNPATQLNDLRGQDSVSPELRQYFRDLYDGQIRFVDDANFDRDAKISLAVDKRWQNTLTLRLEHFYQRSCANDSDDYQLIALADNNNVYLARNYTAIGASYELSPLWFGDAVWLFNHQDASKLLALYSTYSLSDESELSFGINIPVGKQSEYGRLKTEFGSFPHSLTVEYRVYF